MGGPDGGASSDAPQTKWLRFGIGIAILQAVFLLLVVALLRIDRAVGLGVAVSLSVLGGIVVTVAIFYYY
ncbi:hypothetical protein [Natrinema salaciae]|uniref:Uncharacterized protein n=1 Tax=Natrinema salaciae TaxID=1186196 RepID=A0A1H9GKR2_9EURY|nr:hypothetical protein [Natrinema salaciae]SEQ50518.1 hypothetical protein SAMN04489841_1912 [Natrinema salaciae]